MVGGRNITDEYPDKDELGDDCCGRLYDSGSTRLTGRAPITMVD